MEENKNPFSELVNQVKEYTDLRIELLRLEAIDKTSGIMAGLFSFLFTFLIVTFLFFSIYICASLYIGQYFNNYAMGFGISGMICLLILLLYWFLFRVPTKRYISNKIISFFNQP